MVPSVSAVAELSPLECGTVALPVVVPLMILRTWLVESVTVVFTELGSEAVEGTSTWLLDEVEFPHTGDGLTMDVVESGGSSTVVDGENVTETGVETNERGELA